MFTESSVSGGKHASLKICKSFVLGETLWEDRSLWTAARRRLYGLAVCFSLRRGFGLPSFLFELVPCRFVGWFVTRLCSLCAECIWSGIWNHLCLTLALIGPHPHMSCSMFPKINSNYGVPEQWLRHQIGQWLVYLNYQACALKLSAFPYFLFALNRFQTLTMKKMVHFPFWKVLFKG